MLRLFSRVILFLGLCLALLACQEKESMAPNNPAAMPPPTVGVVTVKLAPMTLYDEYPARLEAVDEAVVRARVSGIIDAQLFTEGATVDAGQPLYHIDDQLFIANLHAAQAQLAKAQSARDLSQTTVKRYRGLVKSKAVSQQQYDQAKAELAANEANIAVAQAALEQAQINLNYTHVDAPIAGIIGRALVKKGTLVSQAQATELAHIQNIDKLYVNIQQSANQQLRLRQQIKNGELSARNTQAVTLILNDGSEYKRPATLSFSDVTVDRNTGQVQLRALVDNPEQLLIPGLYVRAKMPLGILSQATLLPQQAVTLGQGQAATVLVVDSQGQYAPRQIIVAGSLNNDWIVSEGLSDGEQVIVDGIMRLRGAKQVNPVPWQDGVLKTSEQPPKAKTP